MCREMIDRFPLLVSQVTQIAIAQIFKKSPKKKARQIILPAAHVAITSKFILRCCRPEIREHSLLMAEYIIIRTCRI